MYFFRIEASTDDNYAIQKDTYTDEEHAFYTFKNFFHVKLLTKEFIINQSYWIYNADFLVQPTLNACPKILVLFLMTGHHKVAG